MNELKHQYTPLDICLISKKEISTYKLSDPQVLCYNTDLIHIMQNAIHLCQMKIVQSIRL